MPTRRAGPSRELLEAWLAAAIEAREWYTVAFHAKCLIAGQEDPDAVGEMVAGAVEALLAGCQVASASDLVRDLVVSLERRAIAPSDALCGRLGAALTGLPRRNSHPAKMGMSRRIRAWTRGATPSEGLQALHVALGEALASDREFADAAEHLIRAGRAAPLVELLRSWMDAVYVAEHDLCLTKATMLVLLQGTVELADALHERLKCETFANAALQAPLGKFCEYLLRALQRDALPALRALVARYKQPLSRDPWLETGVDRIARKYYREGL